MATIDVMISEEEIAKKVEELAKQIEKDYEGEQLLVVGILKGASVFVSDLIRCKYRFYECFKLWKWN